MDFLVLFDEMMPKYFEDWRRTILFLGVDHDRVLYSTELVVRQQLVHLESLDFLEKNWVALFEADSVRTDKEFSRPIWVYVISVECGARTETEILNQVPAMIFSIQALKEDVWSKTEIWRIISGCAQVPRVEK